MPLFPGIFASAISGHLTPADAGSMFPIGEFTLASAQANVEFTNIPQTYTHLQIRAISKNTKRFILFKNSKKNIKKLCR